MNKFCLITKRSYLKGKKISYSNIKTNKKFYLNIKKKKIKINKNFKKIKLSTKGIKLLNKKFNLIY